MEHQGIIGSITNYIKYNITYLHLVYEFCDLIPDDIWNVFEETDVLPKHKDSIFLTLDDAVEAAHCDRKELTDNGTNKVDIDAYSFTTKYRICN